MKVRHKKGYTGISSKFNTLALSEIIVYFDDDLGADSDFISNYDVYLESKNEWKDMKQAFRDHDIIEDNYATYFFEPQNEEDRKRGFTL